MIVNNMIMIYSTKTMAVTTQSFKMNLQYYPWNDYLDIKSKVVVVIMDINSLIIVR